MELKATSVGEMSFCLASFSFLFWNLAFKTILEFEEPVAAHILPDLSDKGKVKLCDYI